MYGKASLKWAWLSHVNHLNFGGHNHIPRTADRLRRCQLSSPVINFWQSVAMLITSTVEICIQQLGIVEEMVFTARRSYASAVLEVVILDVCPSVRLSVCHTRALWLIQRTYRRYFYATWKDNPSSQMWFFVQLCSSWQNFNWLKASRGPSAIAELLANNGTTLNTAHNAMNELIYMHGTLKTRFSPLWRLQVVC